MDYVVLVKEECMNVEVYNRPFPARGKRGETAIFPGFLGLYDADDESDAIALASNDSGLIPDVLKAVPTAAIQRKKFIAYDSCHEAAWKIGNWGYLAIQQCECGWDYTFFHLDGSLYDGGQFDAEGSIIKIRDLILRQAGLERYILTEADFKWLMSEGA